MPGTFKHFCNCGQTRKMLDKIFLCSNEVLTSTLLILLLQLQNTTTTNNLPSRPEEIKSGRVGSTGEQGLWDKGPRPHHRGSGRCWFGGQGWKEGSCMHTNGIETGVHAVPTAWQGRGEKRGSRYTKMAWNGNGGTQHPNLREGPK